MNELAEMNNLELGRDIRIYAENSAVDFYNYVRNH